MNLFECLPSTFYSRDVVTVARELLGMRLVRLLHGQLLHLRISETEAYRGEEDLACHARAGRTARTEVMYGPPGRAYVYFTYGMHWMLNAVCEREGFPAAVLIRAAVPLDGHETIAARRAGQPPEHWCDGPAKLTQALGIHGLHNGLDLTTTAGGVWIEPDEPAPDEQVLCGPRVGLGKTPEPWLSQPWRFRIAGAFRV